MTVLCECPHMASCAFPSVSSISSFAQPLQWLDNKKVAPVINFDEVRAAQSEWIKGLGDWHEGYKYAFVVAHMA